MKCQSSKKRNRDEGAVTRKADIEQIQRERETISLFIYFDK